MGIFSKLFGPDAGTEKKIAFEEIERKFAGEDVKKAKAAWLTMRGNDYAMRRRFDDAIKDFQEALEYEPDRPTTLVSLGGAYNHKKNWANGIAALEKAKSALSSIENDFLRAIQEHNMYYELGNAHFFTGDKKQAFQNLRTSLDIIDRIEKLREGGAINDEEWAAIQGTLAHMARDTKGMLKFINIDR